MVLLTGCASGPKIQTDNDPFEGVNRKIYSFNTTLDRTVMKPVSDVYRGYIPSPIRTGISNFFKNILEIDTIVNDFLQGKIKQGGSDTARFLLNSTFGILGIFDVATDLDFTKHEEDFGQTLAVWGVGQGPYLMLPFLGPYTLRGTPGIAVSSVVNPIFYIEDLPISLSATALRYIDLRARSEGAIAFVNEASIDPYAFTRQAYLQRRNFIIYDGDPPIEDDLFDELLEEDDIDL